MAAGNISLVLSVVVGVAGVVITLVAPLYYLVLDLRTDGAAKDVRRSNLSDSQDDIQDDIEEIHDELQEVREAVSRNSHRTETNQQHLHQLIVDGSAPPPDADTAPGHSEAECPLPDQCPWHASDGG